MTIDLCEYLAWDSQFFGHRIGRCIPTTLTADQLPLILDWCHANQIDCLYFLAESNDGLSVQLAEQHDFHLVDMRLTLDMAFKSPPENPEDTAIRSSHHDDIAHLRQIASQSYTDSRFYYDSHFTVEQCDELYATWIEKSCSDYADKVWVIEDHLQPVGFITCHCYVEEARGQIGLFGIDAKARGLGLGQRLINHALHWFYHQGMQKVDVVTQGRNIPAQRVYQQAGFRTSAVQLWYHRWFDQ